MKYTFIKLLHKPETYKLFHFFDIACLAILPLITLGIRQQQTVKGVAKMD